MRKNLTNVGLSLWGALVAIGILIAIGAGVVFFAHPVFNFWLLIGFIAGAALVPQVGLINLVLFLLASFVSMSDGWLLFIRWLVLALTIVEVFVWLAVFGVFALLSQK